MGHCKMTLLALRSFGEAGWTKEKFPTKLAWGENFDECTKLTKTLRALRSLW